MIMLITLRLQLQPQHLTTFMNNEVIDDNQADISGVWMSLAFDSHLAVSVLWRLH